MALSKEELENLSTLLLSVDDNNTRLAFEIIEHQSLDTALLTEIFVVYKLSDDEALKKKAATFLNQIKDARIAKIMESGKLLGSYGAVTPTEKTIRNNIDSYVWLADGLLDGEKMALALYQKYKVGLNYLLKNLSKPNKIKLLRTFVQGTHFELTNCSLTKIPDELYEFTELTSINLYLNKIKTITAKIKVFTKLESLNLASNQLHKLNKALAKLPIKKLDISDNKFKEFPEVIGQLEKLEELNIEQLKYTMPNETFMIPSSVFKLQHLKKITACYNGANRYLGQYIPIYFDNFPNFTVVEAPQGKTLDLTPMHLARYAYTTNGNSEGVYYLFRNSTDTALIKQIIEEQFYDESSETLDFKSSTLHDLPEAIDDYRLKRLNLNSCQLGMNTYPAGMYSRYSEVPRRLSSRLNTIFSVINKNKNYIEEVILNHNNLRIFPTPMLDWTNLKVLDIQDNNISTLPKEFGEKLPHLEELCISDNPLTTLPDSLKQLKKLKRFTMRETKIKAIPEVIGHWESLEELVIYEPFMGLATTDVAAHIPDSFGQLKKLKKLFFYLNGFYYNRDNCKEAYLERLQSLLPVGCEIQMEY